MGLREFSNWNVRDDKEEVEPLKKYIFLCEGSVTEVAYFKHLMKIRRKLGIHPFIDISILERTEGDVSISAPKRLVQFGSEYKTRDSFDGERDTIVVVFDADVFERGQPHYSDILENAKQEKFVVGVTNPCFELFLLLHYENGFSEYIVPNASEFLSPKGLKNKLAYTILKERAGIDSKSNTAIGKLAEFITIAIEEERFLNQDINDCKGKITSNIGQIIDDILHDSV